MRATSTKALTTVREISIRPQTRIFTTFSLVWFLVTVPLLDDLFNGPLRSSSVFGLLGWTLIAGHLVLIAFAFYFCVTEQPRTLVRRSQHPNYPNEL